MPEVTVIVPTRDRPVLLARALDSVRRQTFTDLEVVIVDNNREFPPVADRPDASDALQDPRVRVVDGPRARNAAAARNVGLAAARGQWVTYLDDDDEYRPGKIAAQHQLALTSASPLVLCGYEFVWPHRRRQRQCDREIFRGGEILARAFLGTPVLFHRRNEAVRFDEQLAAGEDVPYALQLIDAFGLNAVPSVPLPLVIVHPQPAGRSVHGDKSAVWQAYRHTLPIARRLFPRRARRAWLAQGRLERAAAGHGNTAHFLRCVISMLRTRGLREWRFATHAVLTRLKSQAPVRTR